MSGSIDSQMEEQDIFNNLPDELVVLIFSHLSPEDLACRVSEVCHRWLAIAKDPVLWASAILAYDNLCPLEFRKTITFAPSLAKLEINMFKYMDDQTVQSILCGSRFVEYLSFYPSPAVLLDRKLSILNLYSRSLKEINMYIDDSYLLPSGTYESLFNILSNMDKLEVLTLRGSISSNYFKHELLCTGFGNLKALNVGGLAMFTKGEIGDNQPTPWQKFIFFIVENKVQVLKKLSLPIGIFDYSMGNVLGNKFPVSCTLEYLKTCEMCLCAVKNLHCLRVLHIVGVSVEMRESSLSLYSSLFLWISDTPQFRGLKELTLENVVVDERNLTVRLLQACQNLECLTLISGFNSPAQLLFVISQLYQTVIKLSIHHMPCLRSRHLECISNTLPNLEVLNLRYNTLTDGILQYYRDHVQPKMPNLELVCNWGYWNRNGGQSWQTKFERRQHSQLEMLKLNAPSSSYVLPSHDREAIRRILDVVNDYEDDD